MSDAICIIVNEAAGNRDAASIASALPGLLAKFGRRGEVRLLRRGRELPRETARAIQEGFGTIVGAGGDGTISAMASRLAGSGRRLGILPIGTFNYVARGFGIPLAIEDAVRVIAEGRELAIDVGQVNERAFLNNAGLGGYVQIVRRRERVFHSWGRSRVGAYWVILRSLWDLRRSLALKVTVDGEVWQYRTPMAFVAKSAYQLEQYGLEGSACIAKRQLALFVAPDCGRFELIRRAFALALGRLQPGHDFTFHCGSEILIETGKRRRHVICDGEVQRLTSPFRFRVWKDALLLLVPPSQTATIPPAEPGALRAD